MENLNICSNNSTIKKILYSSLSTKNFRRIWPGFFKASLYARIFFFISDSLKCSFLYYSKTCCMIFFLKLPRIPIYWIIFFGTLSRKLIIICTYVFHISQVKPFRMLPGITGIEWMNSYSSLCKNFIRGISTTPSEGFLRVSPKIFYWRSSEESKRGK